MRTTKGSREGIHQIWALYLKDFSRYPHLVPSSLLLETPLCLAFYSQYHSKRADLISQVDYWWFKATVHRIWTKYWPNFYFSWITFIVLSFQHSKLQITIRPTPPPLPFTVRLYTTCSSSISNSKLEGTRGVSRENSLIYLDQICCMLSGSQRGRGLSNYYMKV